MLIKLVLTSFISLIIVFALEAATTPTNLPSVSNPYAQCMRVTNAGQQANGQTGISFYNGCGEKLYVNVCVMDRSGETKLYQSGQRIPINGRFTIYTFPDVTPDKVQWIADTSNPGKPTLCTLPQKKR